MWLRINPDEFQHKASKLDAFFWTSTIDKHPVVRKRMPRRVDKVAGGDIFNLLYQWVPEIKEDPSDEALTAWLKAQLARPDIQQLREKTMGDAALSAVTSVKLFQQLMRPRESVFKQILEVRNSLDTAKAYDIDVAREAEGAIKAVQSKLAELIKQQQPQQGDETSEAVDSIASDEAAFSTEGARQEFNKTTLAISNASEDLDSLAELAKVLPGSGYEKSSSYERLLQLAFDERLMSTFKNQAEFRRIMAALGRLRVLAGEVKSRIPKQAPNPIGVMQGRDLAAVLPSEFALLDSPQLKDLFYRKYLDGNLMQYDRRTRLKEGRGPIVGCLDISGSMNGQRTVHSKALLLQLVRMALETKRKFVFIPFATLAGTPTFIESFEDLLEITSARGSQGSYRGLGGGTNFLPPLEAAIEVIGTESSYKKADILFLTDGYSYMQSSELAKIKLSKQELGFRMMGVLFEGSWERSFQALLDLSVTVDANADLTWTEEIFAKVMV